MDLSAAGLKDNIDRCDNLQERINELNGSEVATERKVYTKRLKMCRDLYDFTLNYKNNKEQLLVSGTFLYLLIELFSFPGLTSAGNYKKYWEHIPAVEFSGITVPE